MTGLLNHRAFYRTLEAEVERATRTSDVLSVAIIDVDAFKLVNDSKGHVWGDTSHSSVRRYLQQRRTPR